MVHRWLLRKHWEENQTGDIIYSSLSAYSEELIGSGAAGQPWVFFQPWQRGQYFTERELWRPSVPLHWRTCRAAAVVLKANDKTWDEKVKNEPKLRFTDSKESRSNRSRNLNTSQPPFSVTRLHWGKRTPGVQEKVNLDKRCYLPEREAEKMFHLAGRLQTWATLDSELL